MNSLQSLRKVASLINLSGKNAILVFFVLISIFSFQSSFAQGLVFQNSRLESGKAGADKSVYRFPNVKTGFDALVTIKGRSSTKVALVNIDVTASGHSKAFQPQVTYNGGTVTGRVKWYMDFEVVFVQAGTTKRSKLSEIDVTALDIDGNGDKIREYVVFTDPVNVEMETVSSLIPDELPMIDFDAVDGDPILCGKCSRLSAIVLCFTCDGTGSVSTNSGGTGTRTTTCGTCAGSGMIHSLCNHPYTAKSGTSSGSGKSFEYSGPTTNYSNIDTLATQVMVTGTWANTDEVTFRVGAENTTTGSNSAADRMYSLWFKSFRYLGTAFLPVTLADWKANLSNDNVVLNWTALLEREVSHYRIERSFDGVHFESITRLNATGNGAPKKNYNYTDNIKTSQACVYYRLISVDLNGKDRVSEVRVVRLNNINTIAIAAYPNPVVNELRITIPSNWQGKNVNFEIFNINGIAVKHITSNRAAGMESVNVQDLAAGLYIVKATNGSESATQRIVKSR